MSGEDAIEAIAKIEYIMISLMNITHYYYDGADSQSDVDTIDYALETARFIDENDVTQKLARIRRIISERFDNKLGDDSMGDIERALEHARLWLKPGD